MQVTHTNSGQPVTFEPIEIKLVIETPEELCDFWLRHNLAGQVVDKENGSYLKHTSEESDGSISDAIFWKLLDNLVLARGYKPVR